MRSVPRYPEVREDGSMWVPLAPPPEPRYRPVSSEDEGIVGCRAVVSYATEWILDLRVLAGPRLDSSSRARWVVELCDDGAWHEFKSRGREVPVRDRIVASTALVFLLLDETGSGN